MTDILQRARVGGFLERFKDMGDDTYAEVVAGPPPRLGLAGNIHEPAANTAAIVTLAAAGAGVVNVLAQITVSLSEAPAAAVNLKVEDDTAKVFSVDIAAAGRLMQTFHFTPPMRGTANKALTITLAAGAGTVAGKVSVHAWTE